MGATSYDRIGVDYNKFRSPDPRIERMIIDALGDSQDVLNVGAGTGSYEPKDRPVIAVEPSITMIEQRDKTAAPLVRACAENLPFANGSFDACLAVLTIHHWAKQVKGLHELKRVARRRVVILTWDPSANCKFWLTEDYFPEILALDQRRLPPLQFFINVLGPLRSMPVMIPYNCTDGFLCAYWRQPTAYLDESMRCAISSFHYFPLDTLQQGLRKLEDDLRSGYWHECYGHLMKKNELDLGYRLIVCQL